MHASAEQEGMDFYAAGAIITDEEWRKRQAQVFFEYFYYYFFDKCYRKKFQTWATEPVMFLLCKISSVKLAAYMSLCHKFKWDPVEDG